MLFQEVSALKMSTEVGDIVRRKNTVPVGLQQMLNRLANLALSNNPCCFYECFAISLESDIDGRTLRELQIAPCESFVLVFFIFC